MLIINSIRIPRLYKVVAIQHVKRDRVTTGEAIHDCKEDDRESGSQFDKKLLLGSKTMNHEKISCSTF